MTTTEAEMIAQEVAATREIEQLLQRRDECRKARRALPKPSTGLNNAREALREAQAKVQRLQDEQAEATALLSSLNDRLDQGDETVAADEITHAEKRIERAGRLLASAANGVRTAELELAPLESDEHLAHLTADALETFTDVPVVIHKNAEDAPAVQPLIIVSQTTPTKAYGTINASGNVRLTGIGCEIETESLNRVLTQWGSECVVTSTGVTFSAAAWPVPRLTRPDRHSLAELMVTFANAWSAQIGGSQEVEMARKRGFGTAIPLWTGFFSRGDESFTYDAGRAVGTARFLVAAQHKRGQSMTLDELRQELAELVGVFHSEIVGRVTEAGEAVSITLRDVSAFEGIACPWQRGDVVHANGSPVWPITAEAGLTIEYAYSPTEEA